MCRKKCKNICDCGSSAKYTGPTIECLGIIQDTTTYDEAFQKLGEYICNIDPDLQRIDNISFVQSTGTPTNVANQSGATDTYTLWADPAQTISIGTFSVYNGTNGQGIDHTSFTSTSIGSGGANQEGAIDTYTVWGDVAETINLGTFLVYNGLDSQGVKKVVFERQTAVGDRIVTIPFSSLCIAYTQSCNATPPSFVDMHIQIWGSIDAIGSQEDWNLIQESDLGYLTVGYLTGDIEYELIGFSLPLTVRTVIIG